MSELLNFECEGDIAVITMDDGKANAAGFDMLEAINGALDRAEAEAKAVIVMGRPGILSGGFDLKVIRSGDTEAINRMVNLGVRTLMRLYGHPQPVVVAATGHAVALGAFMLLTGDYRVGTQGDFSVGLNETAIGLSLPTFGVRLAEARLASRHLTQAAISARLYTPTDAVDVGFMDEVVSPGGLRNAAMEKAAELAELDSAAFAHNKMAFRGRVIDEVLDELSD